jgi:hypothetical protein
VRRFLLVGIHVGSSVVKEPITVSDTRRTPMPTDPEIVDRLTNALQAALILAQQLAADVTRTNSVAILLSAAKTARPAGVDACKDPQAHMVASTLPSARPKRVSLLIVAGVAMAVT